MRRQDRVVRPPTIAGASSFRARAAARREGLILRQGVVVPSRLPNGFAQRALPSATRCLLENDVKRPAPSPAVTNLLVAWGGGDKGAFDQLMPLVHAELRRLARRQLGHERLGHTLQPTALVHEAYLRLVDIRQVHWQNRAHFFAMAARCMRRILVDFARSRLYQKRGGGMHQVTLDPALVAGPERGKDVVALDDALQALAQVDARKGRSSSCAILAG